MTHELQEVDKFKFIETNGGTEVLLLLHGLFGALSNFAGIINHFSEKYNVVVPMLPIFELPIREATVSGLVEHCLLYTSDAADE